MAEPGEQAACRVTVAGRVQGVGFRAWTAREAARLGLRGWVRNEPDGCVKAEIAGTTAAVRAMLQAFHRGPRGAAVISVTADPIEPDRVPPGFRVTGLA